VTNHWFSCPN